MVPRHPPHTTQALSRANTYKNYHINRQPNNISHQPNYTNQSTSNKPQKQISLSPKTKPALPTLLRDRIAWISCSISST